MCKKIIQANSPIKTKLNEAKFMKRGEGIIINLLHHLKQQKDLRVRVPMKSWQLSVVSFMYDFKQQQVAPGTVVVYSAPDFCEEIFQRAQEKPKINKLFKKHNLYDSKTLYDTLFDVLSAFTLWSGIQGGIHINEDTIILFDNIPSASQNQDLPKKDLDAKYEEIREEYPWSLDDFDWLMNKFIEHNTNQYVTVSSEDEFFKVFKEYVDDTLLPSVVEEDDESKYEMLIKLASSIEYFYTYVCEYNIFILCTSNFYWNMDGGYVVLLNEDLAKYDSRNS